MIIIKSALTEGINNFDKTIIESARQRVIRELKDIFDRNDKIVPNDTRTTKFYLCLLDGALKGIYEFLPDDNGGVSSMKGKIFALENTSNSLIRNL